MLASHRKKLDAKPDFYLLLGCRSHYNVELLNIGVSGTNVTTPTAFDLSNSGGVIMDSGTTLTYLVQPAYDQFQAKVRDCMRSGVLPVAFQFFCT